MTRARLRRRRHERDRFEFVWVSVAFLAAASLARSKDPNVDALLMEVVAEADDDQGELYGPWCQWTPASSASHWLLRRRLSHHWRQGVALGPGDLSDQEISFLRHLVAPYKGRPGAGAAGLTLHEFGIFQVHLERDLPRLAGEVYDWLNGMHEGMFAQTWVRWSRWKWLRNAWLQTHRIERESRFAAANEIADRLLHAAPAGERPALKTVVDEEIRVASTLGW
jgi:hypothetical protein